MQTICSVLYWLDSGAWYLGLLLVVDYSFHVSDSISIVISVFGSVCY